LSFLLINFMKYLAIIFLSLTFVNPALAAKKVEGSVPVFKPLLSAPVTGSPNLSHNIQFKDPSGNEGIAPGANPSVQPGQQTEQRQTVGAPAEEAKIQSRGGNYFLWCLIILAIVLAGWLVLIRLKSKNNV